MSKYIDMGNVVLRPHVSQAEQGKAGAKANTYLFKMGERAKMNYLTREEILWLLDNAESVQQILENTRDQVRDAAERRQEAEIKRDLAKAEKNQAKLAADAGMGAALQAMMAQMAKQQEAINALLTGKVSA